MNFHSYLLKHHSGFRPMAGVNTTQVTTYQVPYYRQYVTVLCQHSTFLLQGRDAHDFLQGQLCGDVRELSPEQALWTAHCTPKGRVFASLLLVKRGDETWAFCPESNAPELIERLRKYILFSKLEIKIPENKLALIECGGPDSEEALKDFFPKLPKLPMAVARLDPPAKPEGLGGEGRDESYILRLHGEQPRWLIVAATDATAIAIWEKLTKTHCPIGQQAHQRQLIEAGLVEVGKELQETFLPQMIGLDRVGAMSLKKGCYVGQEVIARTTNLGKLKRQLYRAELAGNPAPAIGTDIIDASSAVLGTCVNSYYDEESEQTQILAVIAERGLKDKLYCKEALLRLMA